MSDQEEYDKLTTKDYKDRHAQINNSPKQNQNKQHTKV